MASTQGDTTSVYKRILGERWHDLDVAVRQFLQQSGTHSAVFNVTNGDWWLSRLMARSLRLPRAGAAVPVCVTKHIDGMKEIWVRAFPDVSLTSTQWEEDGLLHEKMGIVLCVFSLSVADGCLMFRHLRTHVVIMRRRFKLPAIISPSVAGFSERGSQSGETFVHVSIWLPVARMVLSYAGTVL